jgi:hypothetical protein
MNESHSMVWSQQYQKYCQQTTLAHDISLCLKFAYFSTSRYRQSVNIWIDAFPFLTIFENRNTINNGGMENGFISMDILCSE